MNQDYTPKTKETESTGDLTNPTPNTTTPNKEGLFSKWNHTHKVKLQTVIACALIFVVLINFALFIPIQGQSPVSRFLDTLGFHKQSMGLELLTSGGIQKDYLNDIQSGQNCIIPGQSLSQDVRVLQTSGTTKTIVSTIDSKYSNDLKADVFFSGNINADQKTTFANLKLEGEISEKLVSQDKSESSKKYSLKLDASNITNIESSFVRLDKLAIESPEISSDNSLKDWYKGNIPYPDTQGVNYINEVNNIVENADEITTFNTSEILSDQTLAEIAKQGCQGLGEIDVKRTEVLTINDNDIRVRPVRVNFDFDKALNSAGQSQELANKLANDPKLESYVLAQFEPVDSILESVEKIAPPQKNYNFDDEPTFDQDGLMIPNITETSPELRMSKEMYQEQVKSLFKAARDEANKPSTISEVQMQEDVDGLNEFVDLQIYANVYFDVATFKLITYNTVVEFKLNDKAFEEMNGVSDYAKDLLKSGIKITQVSTYKTAGEISIPTDFKDIDSLQGDARIDDSIFDSLDNLNPFNIVTPTDPEDQLDLRDEI